MTEKQEKFLELLGVKLGQKFEIEGFSNTYYFVENGTNNLCLCQDEGNIITINQFIFTMLLFRKIMPIKETTSNILLTYKEKEYLEKVCRHFNYKINYIEKMPLEGEEYVTIILNLSNYDGMDDKDILLPSFQENERFKGLDKWKKYTLRELGLLENE